MAMITGAERERNRAALMNAARELLMSVGPMASLPAIAEAAGLTTGAIYSIFGSRGAMFAEIMEDEAARFYDALGELRDDALALPDVLGGVARLFLAQLGDDDSAITIAFEVEVSRLASTDAALRKRLSASKLTHCDRLTELLTDRRIAEGSAARTTRRQARRLAITADALLTGLYSIRHQIPDEVPAELFRTSVAGLARGIAAD